MLVRQMLLKMHEHVSVSTVKPSSHCSEQPVYATMHDDDIIVHTHHNFISCMVLLLTAGEIILFIYNEVLLATIQTCDTHPIIFKCHTTLTTGSTSTPH